MKHVMPPIAVCRLAAAAFVAVLGACASTSLTSSWVSPDYRDGPLKKLAIFVMAKDESIRRFAEDQMVRRMPEGTTASAGYVLFDKTEVDHERVRAALVRDGYDGVLVSRLVSVDKSETYVPPQANFVPLRPLGGISPYYGNFGGYYGYGYTMMQTTPGYTVENTTIVVETILYKLPDDKPVWTGTTKTLDPRSRPEMVQAIAQLVEEEMKKNGLIGRAAR
jgi:hypothetical protein